MIHLGMLLLSLGGFLALCAARDRHQGELLRRRLPAERSRALRWMGTVLIAAALLLGWIGFGFGYGLVAWIGTSSLAALLTMVVLMRRTQAGARR